MSSTTHCPHCDALFNVPLSAGGRSVACKKCGKVFQIVIDPVPGVGAAYETSRPSAVPPPPPRRGPVPAMQSDDFDNDAGIYRCGKKLVLEIGADLPHVCLKTNEPAVTRLTRKMSWHPPAVYFALLLGLIPYIIIAIAVSKKATIEVPIGETVRSRRKTWITIGLIALFAGMGLLLYGISLAADNSRLNDDTGGILALAGFVILFLDLFVAVYVGSTVVKPTKIDHDYVWLTGVNKEYLSRLPEF